LSRLQRLPPSFRAILTQGGCNGVAIGVGLAYLRMYTWGALEQSELGLTRWIATAGVLVYIVGWLLLLVWVAPIRRAFQGPHVRPDLSPAQRLAAQRRALAMPALFGGSSMLLWIVTAASFPVFQRLVGGVHAGVPARVVIGTLMIGTVASTISLYAVELSVRRSLLPRLQPMVPLGKLGPVLHVGISTKIALLVATHALAVVGLMALRFDPYATPTVFLFFGGTALVVSAIQAYLLRRSVVRPVLEVASAQRQVGDNDLAAHVAVQSADALGVLAEGFNLMVSGLKRAEQVKNTFGSYVHPRVVEDLIEGRMALGGELRTATILFADIRGFTALSESLPPRQVVTFLNSYLERMVEAIAAHGGTVDKFIGDGIMAVFGVPYAQGDDAMHAVRAGWDMLAALEAWNAERRAQGQFELSIGIGIHTGEAVAGSIGTSKKMQYTLIGDAVNTASRIESATVPLGVRLLVSAATFGLVSARVQAREFPPVVLKGKAQPVPVYEITGLREGRAE